MNKEAASTPRRERGLTFYEKADQLTEEGGETFWSVLLAPWIDESRGSVIEADGGYVQIIYGSYAGSS